ncbi:MAG: trypsin-like peptidase domain-containing protein [Parcubacteria group bacterium]|nr:trypsin-like peptidase domain-containing protein [Parcubacteria group bacterium]
MKYQKEKSAVVEIAKKVMPAVVSIAVSKNAETLEKELAGGRHLFPFWHTRKFKVPEEEIDRRGMVKVGGGSGFIADSSGIIVTNKHVIADSDAEYAVIASDGASANAEILARDPVNDVAILKVNFG